MRKPLTFIAVVLAVVALAANVAAQSPPRPSAPPKVVVVNAHSTTSVDGATLYQAYARRVTVRLERAMDPLPVQSRRRFRT